MLLNSCNGTPENSTSVITSNAIMGGGDTDSNIPYAYTFVYSGNSNNPGTPVLITPLPLTGEINSVAINASGTTGIIGGSDTHISPNTAFAYTVDITGSAATPITDLLNGTIQGVAISADGKIGLLGGNNGGSPTLDPYAYTVDIFSNSASLIALPGAPSGTVSSMAINAEGTSGLLGGGDFSASTPFAYSLVNISGSTATATALTLSGMGGVVSSVAIDASGTNGILGLTEANSTSPDYFAYTVNIPDSTVTPITTPQSYVINSVAINSPTTNGIGTTCIIGGSSSGEASGDPVAYIINIETSTPTEISGLGMQGTVNSVAIDSAGSTALLGGEFYPDTGFAYVFDTTTLNLTTVNGLSNSTTIVSAAIQDSGKAGLLGGSGGNNETLVAFLLPDLVNNPSNAIQLTLTGINEGNAGSINSVSFDALSSMLNSITTSGLWGNNLALAEYLNEYAPDTAFYFMPSTLDGTLVKALESVAPTRNASSLFTVNNSFFAIREGITRRTCDARQFSKAMQSNQGDISLLTARGDELPCKQNSNCRLNEFWGEIVGLTTYQDCQNETPSFHPLGVGFILGYDFEKIQNVRLGATLAYMYNHLHQNNGQGHSHTNQELASLYSLWQGCNFYANAEIWVGLFQVNTVRDIHMTAFDYRATSYTSGYQFDPHLELGYDYQFHYDEHTLEPFVMFDWVHSWQDPYREYSTGPFQFVQQRLHASMFRTEVGLRCYEQFSFCSWNLILQENISYIYRKPYSIGDVKGFLIGAPGTLILETFTSARNLGSVELRFLFEPKNPQYPTGTFGYRGEFGSGYQSHQISFGTEWSF